MKNIIDCDDPCLRLWLTIFIDAYRTVQVNPASEVERDFLFSEDNLIIDALAEALGTDGDTLRHRARAGLARTRRRRGRKRRTARQGDAT